MNPRKFVIVTISAACCALLVSSGHAGLVYLAPGLAMPSQDSGESQDVATTSPAEPAAENVKRSATRVHESPPVAAQHDLVKPKTGSADVSRRAGGAPPNDFCPDAEDVFLQGTFAQVQGTTVGATFDGAPFCDTDNTAPGVWYRIRGTGNLMTASMCHEFVEYDAKISVFCAGCDTPQCVAGNDDAFCPGLPSTFPEVRWCSLAGEEYLVLVHGFSTETGGFLLNFNDSGDPCTGAANCQPDVACCFRNGGCDEMPPLACQEQGGQPQQPGSTCANTFCPAVGACCVQGDCIDNLQETQCVDQNGSWFSGAFCDAAICKEACCLPDGACRDTTPADCQSAGGSLQGPGTDCASTVCTPLDCGQSAFPECGGVCPPGFACQAEPTGACRCVSTDVACCFPNGGCDEMQVEACIANGGQPNEPGSTCANTVCVAVGACCAPPACLGGGNCDTGSFSNRCGGTFDCFCFDTAEGSVSCTQSHSCAALAPCPNGTRDCRPGETCNTNTCCGGPRCEPVDCPTGRDAGDGVATTIPPSLGELTTGGIDSSERGGPVGATCQEATREDCAFLGGTYLGDGTICADATCSPPDTVACCLPGGECSNLTPNNCRERGGFPRGPNSACQGDGNGDGIDDACLDVPCEDCGGFDHWVEQCSPGVDSMTSGALVGIDFGANLDCIADRSLVLRGPVHIRRSAAADDSVVFPGTRPTDGHLDVIDTEMVQLALTGGGVLMRAGAAQDVAGLLPPTFGVIAEQIGDPLEADTFFDVFFTVEIAGVPVLYNHDPLKVVSKIDCLPPDATYIHPVGCIPLYDTPPGTEGVIVANLVTANHSTYPACGDPGTGDCHMPHDDTPFCNDGACCEKVCAIEPDCCVFGWPDACAGIAAEVCDRACCLPDGTCRVTSASDCQQAGGLLQGPGSHCDSVTCEPVPCGQSSFPACGGVCPTGLECNPNSLGGDCACEPIPCGESAFPVCDGACPANTVCEPVAGADACRCRPLECAPNAEGTACNGAACLNDGLCNARCVKFDPVTGARTIVDCECRNSSECHVAPLPPGRGTNPCTVADNGSGTVTLPPAGCEYLSPDEVHQIIDGLPAGTTIELAAIHKDFICGRQNDLCSTLLPPGGCEAAGGSLGGNGDCFDSTLELSLVGTGDLTGFARTLTIPIFSEVHTGPRNPGDPVQTFPNDMVRLQGDLFGDPDFCILRVNGGTASGLPSPGQTTLTQLPSGDFNVDSFFDITYQIEFQGCPGSRLEGLSGSTQATIRMQTGERIEAPTCIGACPPGTECERSAAQNADGTVTVCCDCVTVERPAACCLSNGECTDVPPSRCDELGGVSKGPGTVCQGDGNGNGIDDACEDDPCEDCGPGDHWVDGCPAGVDSMPSGAVVGLDLGPVFDCIPDTNLVLRGPVHIRRSDSRDDSVNFPGTSPIDGHPSGPGLDVIDTEMLQLNLTGGGVTLAAGAGQGVAGVLLPSFGAIVEQPSSPALADSFFDVFFEVNNGGTLAYNHDPLRVNSKIDCLPPDATYIHPIGCIPLYDTPPGIDGQVVAQLVTANHSTYPACGDPGTGSCTEPHDSPFCRDETCCRRVCSPNVLPECCEGPWTAQCVQAALEICQGAVEVDEFEFSVGAFELHHPDGNVETIPVSGPATVHVFFEGPNEGDAGDDDGDGLDEVRTEMVDLQLSGFSPKLGPIHATVNPALPSLGVIEELLNNNPGLLDVDPFAPGNADSFFDIFFKIVIGDMEYFTIAPKRMRSRIDTKPPGPTAVYENTQQFELFDANGRPTGFFLGATRHRPRPIIEVDQFDFSVGRFDLAFPGGSVKTIPVSGPATVNVYFEGPSEGDANDSNGNGRDDVPTEMVSLNLVGHHPDLGVVTVGVHPTIPSLGQIEELANNTPGVLDVAPFAPGSADSFFDVFFEIHVGGNRYFTHRPKRMSSRINHKPPGPTTVYENRDDIELFDENGEPTGIILSAARHRPNPVVEVDTFDFSIGQFELTRPDGSTEVVDVAGPLVAHVYFEGPVEGDANDDDGDNLDEVPTELVAMNLTGNSSLGPVVVRLHPTIPSLGLIREHANNTPGVLDVRPFTAAGTADSFFDVFFEVQVAGQRLLTRIPKRLFSVIAHKPPRPGTVFECPNSVPLVDENGEPTGFQIGPLNNEPNPLLGTYPPNCAIDARQPHPVNSLTPRQGWDQLVLRFGSDPSALNLQPGDFAVDVISASVAPPPVITNVITNAATNEVIITLDRPIEPGHWTCVVYLPSGRRWCLGFLPADVNQNQLSNAGDILDLINSLNNVPGRILPLYATDLDRSDVPNAQDILREIDLLNGAGTFRPWLAGRLPDCPSQQMP